jgi:hypothetical protein
MSDRNFFAELKRRNLYEVAVAYAAFWDSLHGDPPERDFFSLA